jgi:hypothetical protein
VFRRALQANVPRANARVELEVVVRDVLAAFALVGQRDPLFAVLGGLQQIAMEQGGAFAAILFALVFGEVDLNGADVGGRFQVHRHGRRTVCVRRRPPGANALVGDALSRSLRHGGRHGHRLSVG